MVLHVGDIVSPHFPWGAIFGPTYQAQPPMFGVIESSQVNGGTVFNVLWYDGKHAHGVHPAACLDEILVSTSSALEGRIVRVAVPIVGDPTPELTGVVVQVHRRDLNGAGAPSADLAVVRFFSGYLYGEIPTVLLEVVEGR